MHLNLIRNLVKLQGFIICDAVIEEKENKLILIGESDVSQQSCPYCHKSDKLSLKGKPYERMVRHLNSFGYKCYLKFSVQRLSCKDCRVVFTCCPDFVDERSSYTNAFKKSLFDASAGATLTYLSELFEIPETTCGLIIKERLDETVPCLQEKLVEQAQSTAGLVLGLDDFATRKGHTYNTGFHDLKNGSYLKICKGRTVEELRKDKELNAMLDRLNPVAVVMDLAASFRKFISEKYPEALIVIDRFHVNRLVTDSLQELRKRLIRDKGNGLTAQARKLLKKSKKLLGKRNEDLDTNQQAWLEEILELSDELSDAYDLKEAFIHWYDMSDKRTSYCQLMEWLEDGREMDIPEFKSALSTIEKRSVEISNYHQYRYTNGPVEGKNNKTKSITRRCFGILNRKYYTQKILHECNLEWYRDFVAH